MVKSSYLQRAGLLVCVLMAGAIHAAPAKMKVVPLGKADAPVGGTLLEHLHAEPETLNPINSTDAYATYVQGGVVESLLTVNSETYDFEPLLAESYEISKDGLTYTFHLNPKAHFSDGQPVTSADVQFSVECVRDPAFQAAHRIPFYEDVKSIETPDKQTIIFRMGKKYYMNLDMIGAGTPVLPKHIYSDPKKRFPIAPLFGSGAYKLESYQRGQKITLVRDPNWWAKDLPNMKSTAKFERITFRFVKDENLALEMMKKGDIDHLKNMAIENFETKAVGEPFGTKIKRVEAVNKRSKMWGFIGWNFKNPMFKERETRIALSHLFNRKLLMEKFMYNKAVEGRGPYHYSSPFMPADVKPIEFSPEKAKALLKKAGWEDKEQKGILQKTINGEAKPFRFTLMFANPEYEKYFTIYKEDLKKAGIDMELKRVEWNAFVRALDEQKFDAVSLRWTGGSPESDLKQIWHSSSARAGGSNFISYNNPNVDKYIDEAREEMNKEKRRKLWQKAAEQIIYDAPYTYMFNLKFDQYLVNNRIGFVKPTYTYDIGEGYWYLAK